LGAADGNSFQQFLANAYGPVANCPSGQWEALLVEANPQFTPKLNTIAATYPGAVHAYSSTAAYMCPGTTSFSIDPDVAHNHWGSSMKANHGSQTVTVPMVNVMQLISENVATGDWVILKVDIEGAEYDVIPCLAQFSKATNVDIIFLEEHGWLQKNSAYTPAQYTASKLALKNAGITMPDYHSGTL
jgi:FkbM family methyltransferase